MPSQLEFTSAWEGKIPHLYLDSRGNPTCGVGFLVPNKAALKNFPWSPNLQTAEADFVTISEISGVHSAGFYRTYTRARLSDESMRRIFDQHVLDVRKQLQRGWNLTLLPEPAQIALTDMAFNLGVGGLSKYAKLRAACNKRDWDNAADECRRVGIQAARNDATRRLFLSCKETE